MDIGISLPAVGPAAEREFLLATAQAADRLEFHSVWTSDHVIFPKERRSEYPYKHSTTEIAVNRGVAWLDPVAVMGVVAGATERVSVGTSVLVLPYRSPIILANEVASLDRLSQGRVLLGVGAGWMDEEFAALGVPRAERGARTDEYIRALRALWSSADLVSFEGEFVHFTDMTLATRPYRPEGPPIYVGGNSPAALRRAGALADGWLGFEVFVEDIPEARGVIESAAKEAGRDPTAIILSARRGLVPPFEVSNFLPERRAIAGSPRVVADELLRYRDQGVSLVVLDIALLPGEVVQTLDWLAAEVRPLLK